MISLTISLAMLRVNPLNPDTIRFRTAQANDATSIAALVNSAYRGDHAKKGWTTESDLLDGQRTDVEAILELIQTPQNSIELALNDWRHVIGCVHLRIETPSTLYFGMLTVEPTAQTAGIGKKLLEHLEHQAQELALKEIRMTVLPQRKELIAFYERRGFTATGQSEPFPTHDPRYGIPKVQGLILMEYKKFL
jgi:ribosomal protein S18 acetylase RimI-like enzyme